MPPPTIEPPATEPAASAPSPVPDSESDSGSGSESFGQWRIRSTTGSAGRFHERLPADDCGPEIWIHTIERPALVLGSTQPDDLVDFGSAEAEGIEVCRRRSGGGLVWIDPATDCWIDVIVPTGSALWHEDVGKAFHWLGHTWAAALRQLGVEATLHRTSTTGTSSLAGAVWCFSDLGHGELSLNESKVLGLSQRRTRNWVRLQGLVLATWPGPRLARYVDPEAMVRHRPQRFEALKSLDELNPERVQAGFPAGVVAPDPTVLATRFVASLPRP